MANRKFMAKELSTQAESNGYERGLTEKKAAPETRTGT
jgi:hypothetical protein